MKCKELKTKTEKDLIKMVADKRQALKDFRFGIAGSKIKNVKEGKNLRKEISQMLTVLNSGDINK